MQQKPGMSRFCLQADLSVAMRRRLNSRRSPLLWQLPRPPPLRLHRRPRHPPQVTDLPILDTFAPSLHGRGHIERALISGMTLCSSVMPLGKHIQYA